jgi:hypothetical protein
MEKLSSSGNIAKGQSNKQKVVLKNYKKALVIL